MLFFISWCVQDQTDSQADDVSEELSSVTENYSEDLNEPEHKVVVNGDFIERRLKTR